MEKTEVQLESISSNLRFHFQKKKLHVEKKFNHTSCGNSYCSLIFTRQNEDVQMTWMQKPKT